jgi:octaprenyl-diphosphate synthase
MRRRGGFGIDTFFCGSYSTAKGDRGDLVQSNPQTINWLQLLEPIAPALAQVEELLGRQAAAFAPRVGAHIQYALSGSGKRLRPSLALLTGGATGGVEHEHVVLGVIVELIHVATLVHDDVLDEAELRHGQPTCQTRWGNEISVLVGDCLFAHALGLAASYQTNEVCRRISAATNQVCAGEILQTERRFDLELSVADYLDIIGLKTGALFAVSCELGALLNGAAPAVVQAAYEFGRNLGTAYQIYDDCVDILGQERQTGKSLGTDMKKGKLTLPTLLALQHAVAADRRAWGEMILRGDDAERRQLVRWVTGNGAVTGSLDQIAAFVGHAQRHLQALPVNPHSRVLGRLAEFLAERSRSLVNAVAAA